MMLLYVGISIAKESVDIKTEIEKTEVGSYEIETEFSEDLK